MNPRRLYAPVVLGTLAAGVLSFFAAGRTWAQVKVATDGLPSDSVKVTGTDAQPLVAALAVVVVTAALAVLASPLRARRVIGVFTVLVSIAGVLVVVLSSSALDDAVKRAVEASPAFTGGAHRTFDVSAWKYVAVVGFVLSAVLGAVTTRFGPLWPTMSTRYERGPRPDRSATTTDADMWKALDEGHDPTQ
ncbi:Trp biosynthesis-associated membrane protein [Aeromicrobium sp.]|uniref:Trp biosynthesis-associated membrane protein n=1 Tax=Aeromicrobium sp. TaxID=1871063 RepID=UPI0019BF8D86|nr:Trp biosynthesis-associated membrane protein [Aeromicrobium sp.]MBC7631008.1 Trp biosynthesis-associated membrane protein [Aeromicrobium sp.]